MKYKDFIIYYIEKMSYRDEDFLKKLYTLIKTYFDKRSKF